MANKPHRSVFFAIPAASSVVEVDLVQGLFRELADFVNNNWGIALQFAVGNNGIHMARNFLVQRFLDSGCTDLFFIDADMAWEPGALIRMIEHPVDFVLGLYRLKHPQEKYTYFAQTTDLQRDPHHGLIPIDAGPFGFVRLKRIVIERMIEALPPKELGGWTYEPMQPQYPMPVLFNFVTRKDGTTGMMHNAGEDMDFCMKWGEMGGQVWLDPDLTLHHIGKIKYSSNFWNSYTSKRHVLHDRYGDTTIRDPVAMQAELAAFEHVTNGAAP